jgi:cytochrome c553
VSLALLPCVRVVPAIGTSEDGAADRHGRRVEVVQAFKHDDDEMYGYEPAPEGGVAFFWLRPLSVPELLGAVRVEGAGPVVAPLLAGNKWAHGKLTSLAQRVTSDGRVKVPSDCEGVTTCAACHGEGREPRALTMPQTDFRGPLRDPCSVCQGTGVTG